MSNALGLRAGRNPSANVSTSYRRPYHTNTGNNGQVRCGPRQVPDTNEGFETISVDFFNTRTPLQAFGSIWFLSDMEGKVTRWHPEAHRVLATIEVGDPGKAPYGDPVAAVATNDAVWITSVAAHEIVKVDPQTNQIVDRIAIPKANGDRVFFTNVLTLAGNTLWVWDYDLRLAQAIDLNTRQVIGTMERVMFPVSLENSVWVPNLTGNVSLVDPQTAQVMRQLPQLPTPTLYPAVSANGSIRSFDVQKQTVYRMDPESFEVNTRLEFSIPVRDLKVVDGSLWASLSSGPPPSCHTNSYLVKIDPETNTVTGKTGLDCLLDLVPYEDTLWIPISDGSNDSQMLLAHIIP